MIPGQANKLTLRGHTVEDKLKSVEFYLNELYRQKGTSARPVRIAVPVAIAAYGESAMRSRDKIYSTFVHVGMRTKGAMIFVDCPAHDKVRVEVELIAGHSVGASGGIYGQTCGAGFSEVALHDAELQFGDIVNVYMTYLPADASAATKAGVTVCIYGDAKA